LWVCERALDLNDGACCGERHHGKFSALEEARELGWVPHN
jgi:hypothetical protein